jgi:plastocyanin
MIDTFDSRALGRIDCFGQRFMRTGTYRYHLVPAAWAPATYEHPYTVEVGTRDKKRKETMATHTVQVRFDGKAFQPASERAAIEEGDLVIWHCPDARHVPLAVVGDKEFFGNRAMVNECGFSHAFAAAGEYAWVDAYGSGLAGVVRVKDPDCRTDDDFREWHRTLTAAKLVMITGSEADPAEVDILTGQTVYFAVTKSEGVSVTDRRLVRNRPEAE